MGWTADAAGFDASSNDPPTAVVGADQVVDKGTLVQLDGSESWDPEGEPLTYAWDFASKPAESSANIANADQPVAAFVADAPGVYRVALFVHDGVLFSPPAQLMVTATNAAPLADAGPDQVVDVGSPVSLDGSQSSDADDESLEYSWTLAVKPQGSTASIDAAGSDLASFVPDVPGDYVVQLQVSDGFESSTDMATVEAHPASFDILPYRVVDAEYSEQLERIIMVSSSPAELHIYDPVAQDEIAVGLPLTPTAVSVGPDGTTAAVGHNAWVSYIDLQEGELIETYPVTTDALDVVLAGNGYVYVFPKQNQWESIRCVELETGEETTSGGWSIYAGTLAKLHPTQPAMYGADNGLSPSDIEKYDISNGTAQVLYDSPYHGDYPMCGNLWISEDGARIFTRCGNVFRADENQQMDMTYNGKLEELSLIQSADHSAEADVVAAIPGNSYNMTSQDEEVQLYAYQFLTYEGSIPIPPFYVGGSQYSGHGRFVFFDSEGTELFVVQQAAPDSGLLHDYAVYRHSL